MATGGASFHKGSDLIHDYSCSTCEENDLNTEAQHFCPQCEHYLCDKCVKLHGGYFKKHVVYGRGDIQKWADFSMDICYQHGNKLEVHCDDHQELCCSVCVALNHRLCSSISHLPDLARGFLETAEFKQLPAVVDKMRSRLDELKNVRTKDQDSLIDSYKNIIAEVKALRKNINTILDQLERKTVEQLDRMMKDLEKSIKDDLETCAQMDHQLKTMIEKLQQITGKNKETSSYIGYIKCQSKLSEATCFVQEIRHNDVMKLKSDESVVPFLRNLKNLGDIEKFQGYKTQSSAQYSVKIKEDNNVCDIECICELPGGEVVIADFANSRVKLLNKKYRVTDHYDFPAGPLHLCHITNNDVAVAFINSEVHFLTLTRGKLQAVRKFTTDHETCSIAHIQSQLFVSSNDAIYLYTIKGTFVKKIYEAYGFGLQASKCAVSTDGERFYVTNMDDSKLITLDKTGQVISTLEDSDLKDPTGLCVSPSGHVFVCWWEPGTVLQVDKEGRQRLATVAGKADGLCKPQSVWFSEQTSTLLVGNLNTDTLTVLKLC
ncbi:uncharacterized protein LOC128238634 [Mya arenaria]|uniref:uncharacterized protein LOC128238634 n=1 Tax=Mya arenaria TaxID=6604 RepID=UPI0022E31F03|nr:uncharacterized protein LOC128238634 [Mya arenaria]